MVESSNTETQQETAKDEDRYVALGTTENKVVIFDRQNDAAWIKSDGAIEKGALR